MSKRRKRTRKKALPENHKTGRRPGESLREYMERFSAELRKEGIDSKEVDGGPSLAIIGARKPPTKRP